MKNYENVDKSKSKVFGIFRDNPPTINMEDMDVLIQRIASALSVGAPIDDIRDSMNVDDDIFFLAFQAAEILLDD